MPESRPLRIGFCGAGSMGQCAHLRNYHLLPECEVVALAELRPQTAELVARRYGIPNVYSDATAMLASEELDAIVASQPFQRHSLLLPELLASGLPVFIEKPLAGTLAGADAILQALAASDTFVMVGYHKRSDPATQCAVRTVRELQGSGELGKLTYVRLLMPAGDWIAGGFDELLDGGDPRPELPLEPPAADLDPPAFARYTAFVNYYIHQVNLMRYLLGEDWQVTFADPSGVLLVGRSSSGVCCSLEMTPYRTTVDWQESALVAFECGYVKLELPAPLARNRPGRVEVLRDPGEGATPQLIVPQLPWRHAMAEQARNFLAAVRGEQPPLCTAPEARQDLQLARDYIRLVTGH